MRPAIIARFAVLGAAVLGLCGCQTISDAAGKTKYSPDEFAVVTKAPLIIPPDFALRPPSPGAPPLNQQDPTTAAANALFNDSDPQTIAANMRGNFTPGEKMLLASAGAQSADPAIRAELQADSKATLAADPSFVDRVLGGKTSPPAANAKPNPAAIQKSGGGWFDWL